MERRRTLGNEGESTMSEEYELVGTASITEETATVEIQLSKPCTDLYLFCENLKSTANSQLIIKLGKGAMLTGINAEISQNGQNTIQHIKKIGKRWIRTGNNHGAYGLDIAAAQMYRSMRILDKWTSESVSSLTLLLQNNLRFTSGTTEIYGR